MSRNQRGSCTCYANIHSATELGPLPSSASPRQCCLHKPMYVCAYMLTPNCGVRTPPLTTCYLCYFATWGAPQTSGLMLGALTSRNKLAALSMLNVSPSACPRGRTNSPHIRSVSCRAMLAQGLPHKYCLLKMRTFWSQAKLTSPIVGSSAL